MKKICFFLLFCLMMNRICAQVIAWDFIGAIGDETAVAPTTVDPHLTASSISRGTGINAAALANAYSANSWGAVNLPDAIVANEYFQFSVQVNTGYQAFLATLNANFRRSATGPNSFQWQYSLDGFTTAGLNMGAAISYTGTATAGDAQATVNLTGISSLQNLPAGTIITLRLYGWGASALSGSFALGRLAGNDLAIGGSNIVVPVLLSSFTGTNEGRFNRLRWSTATELNNLGFEVQRSATGIQYNVIGFVNSLASAGNSNNSLDYSFIDTTPAGTKQYYRLRQVDIDNHSKLSPILLIKGEKPLLVTIDALFPNPAADKVNVSLMAPANDKFTIIVMDINGRTMLRQNGSVETGNTIVTIDISRLNKGFYFLKLVCGGEVLNKRFIKGN
ncbi:MAG: T9SS type A sorting domain-containing protein [Chitinophagaceae bacterium]